MIHYTVPCAPGRRQGFSLLEVLITLTILVVMLGVVMQFTMRGQEMAREETRQAELNLRAMKVLEEITDQIRRSGASTLVPSDPEGTETSLQFTQIVGIVPDTGPVYAANPLTYTLSLAEGETQDGTDENRNGLIDEYVLWRTTGDGARSAVVGGVKGWDDATAANMTGFRVRRVPTTNRLRIGLTLQSVDRWGEVWEAEYITSVTLRNE
jgi:prepilin-type N-terminal cleavage/methylation domain-containing protein